jgi:alpha-mannosidase
LENGFLRVVLGRGGLESVYDKRLRQEVLRTGKFFGGEVLQFTAPGLAWEDLETVTMADFDRTSDHEFPITKSVQGAVRSTVVREAKFKRFLLREQFHLYSRLDRVEIELEVLDWDGEKERELRVVFPVNLDSAQLSYEVPFGTVEIGKDEIDFSPLPPSPDTGFIPQLYGAYKPLRFREAVNWIDASSAGYLGFGCLAASDCTVHLFRDETSNPVSYPVLQHVLLSTRKSFAWNPEYWCTQAGSHRYRMALLPHAGNWRLRYRDGIAFNYPLTAFVGTPGSEVPGVPLPRSAEFLRVEPANLILTAMKKSEDDDRIVLRFYEAEGKGGRARVHLARPIKHACRASLIEEDQEDLQTSADGAVEFAVTPWEIVTIKLAI